MAGLLPENSRIGVPPATPRPVGDVFCPFFKMSFTNQLGATGTIDKQVKSDDVGTVKIPSQTPDNAQLTDTIIKSAAGLTIETTAGSPFKFTLDLTPTYEAGVQILESQIISYLTVVTVTWGYVASSGEEISSGVHHFRVVEPKATFGEDMRITVVGYDLVSDTSTRTTTNRQWNRTKYPRDLDILASICKRAGYVLEATSVVEASTMARPVKPDAKNPTAGAQIQFGTDWQLFKSLCRRHGVTFAVRAGRVIRMFDPFAPPPEGEVVPYTFKWRKELEGTHDIPIYSISGDILPSAFLPPAGGGVFAITVDNATGQTTFVVRDAKAIPDTRETTKPELTAGIMASINSEMAATANETKLPGGDVVNPAPQREADQSPTWIDLTDYSARAAQVPDTTVISEADNIVREAAFFSNPKVKIRCPGVVDVHPGMLVNVDGTGRIYDYTYTVFAVRHILGNSGYEMEVTLMRQGTRLSQNAGAASKQAVKVIPAPKDDPGSEIVTVGENASPSPPR